MTDWEARAIREADRADKAEALLVPIEWWYCVWCEVKYPYTDGPDTLKAHSTVCPSHPGNIRADKAEAALAGKYGFEAAGMVIAAQEERDAARADLALAIEGFNSSVAFERARVADMMAQRDAALKDAKALAQAGHHGVLCATPLALAASGCTCGWTAALAAHKEATNDDAL
jgi:hypothetical protein